MNPVEIHSGDAPIVLGLPHTGTYVPADIFERLTPLGKVLADTDWHIHELYDGLFTDATTVRATFHRYVIDANRDPSGATLYPGQNTTGLVPLTDFDGEPLWVEPPSSSQVEKRRKAYHDVYHEALERELQRVRSQHGIAILYDCHSIRSHIPFLFQGILPDLNIGTNDGRSCSPEIEQVVENICSQTSSYSTVTNGRFKGGWTTRYYGRPQEGIHAIQMELAQSTHLTSEAPPFAYDLQKAEMLRVCLKEILHQLAGLAPELARPT